MTFFVISVQYSCHQEPCVCYEHVTYLCYIWLKHFGFSMQYSCHQEPCVCYERVQGEGQRGKHHCRLDWDSGSYDGMGWDGMGSYDDIRTNILIITDNEDDCWNNIRTKILTITDIDDDDIRTIFFL